MQTTLRPRASGLLLGPKYISHDLLLSSWPWQFYDLVLDGFSPCFQTSFYASILEATSKALFVHDSLPPPRISSPSALWEFIPIIPPVFAKETETLSSLQVAF